MTQDTTPVEARVLLGRLIAETHYGNYALVSATDVATLSTALTLSQDRDGEWQPIDTAKDDGDDFLVGWLDRDTVVVATFNGLGVIVDVEDFAGWIEGQGPTHWRPKPSRPTLKSPHGDPSNG